MPTIKIDSLRLDPDTLVFIAIAWFLVFLFFLSAALSRQDLDPVTKFMWIFVIVSVPLFGVIFYLVMAPARQEKQRPPPDFAKEPTTCIQCSTAIPAGATKCPQCGWSYAPNS